MVSSRANHLAVSSSRTFTARAAIVIALVAGAALVWYAGRVFLLAFAGLLLAILLDSCARWVAATLGIRRGWAFAIVTVALFLLTGFVAWEVVPRVADQVTELVHSLPQSFQNARNYLAAREWGRTVLNHIPSIIASANITGELSSIAGKAFDGLIGLIVIAVVGLYAGAHPAVYTEGLLKLAPGPYRGRTREVLQEVAYTLRWWMLGQLVPMIVMGIATTIGLAVIGVHPAFTLGLFTGVMIFIPYIGSLIAFAVTVLVTLAEGPALVLYVTLLFAAVHAAEGYLLTPMIQRRAVYLPPALTILAQVLLGLLLGLVGFALATPLTAAALVLVRMLYLDETPQHHG